MRENMKLILSACVIFKVETWNIDYILFLYKKLSQFMFYFFGRSQSKSHKTYNTSKYHIEFNTI